MSSEGAGRAIDAADGRSLRSGFLRHALESPDRPALIVADVTRTYGELDAAARRWAGAIHSALGRPAERVGIFASRSETAYTGVLAALYSGAAFVPLNPAFPIGRTQAMARMAQIDALVVDAHAVGQIGALLEGIEVVPTLLFPDDIVGGTTGLAPAFDGTALAHARPMDDLPPLLTEGVAYLLFTSGSTGEPKGVPVTHLNALHFLDVVLERYEFGPDDRFSQTFDQTFDLSVFDQFAAWHAGATLCALQPLDLLAPVRFVNRHRVSVWFSVPSLPALLRKRQLLKPGAMPSLKWSLFCGEPLPRASAEEWQLAAPNSVVENLYGPTELTIACFSYRWRGPASAADCVNDLVPIGRPYAGLGALVLDDALTPVTAGEDGELCVCGPQTVPGYWRAPEKTAERFVELPGPGGLRTRFYRTGDRVRRLPSGDYVYLGRTDHQVKVMGHRVELGEIEAVLMRQPGVTQAVAAAWPIVDGSAEGIVGFVTGAGVDATSIVTACRAPLPAYMVPRHVFVLDAMPLNANGKIDRKALQNRLATGRVGESSGAGLEAGA